MSGDSFAFGRRRFLQAAGASLAGIGLSSNAGASKGRQATEAPAEDEYADILAAMDGDGSEENPYIITDIVELQAINGDLSAQYELGNDIDASVTADWNDGAGFDPLFREATDTTETAADGTENSGESADEESGTETSSDSDDTEGSDDQESDGSAATFTGVLRGNGNEIAGLTINRPDERGAGLFFINNGVVADVVITDATVAGKSAGIVAQSGNGGIGKVVADGTVTGEEAVGGIAGTTEGIVAEIEATVEVTGTNAVGGLVGTSNGNVINSTVSGTVDGDTDVGGVVGKSYNYVERSETDVAVSGTVRVGGLVGDMSGRVAGCTADGTVTGETNIGGVVGECWGELFGTVAKNSVEGEESVGGLIGENHGEVGVCSTHGAVTGTSRVGGLIGWAAAGTVVADSYTVVSTTGESAVGALVGLLGWEFLGDEATAELRRGYWNVDETDHDPVGRIEAGDGDVTVESKTITGIESDKFVGTAATEHMTAFNFQEHWQSRSDKAPVPHVQLPNVFDIAETSTSQLSVAADETFDIEVTVENTGEETATQRVSLLVNGDSFEHTETQLKPGESTQVVFEGLPAADIPVGTHSFTVQTGENSTEGTISVKSTTLGDEDTPSADNETATSTPEPDSTDDNGPGFGIGAALTGVGTGAYLLSHRLGRDTSTDD
ncbi:PGF-CTERM sorting domain-containing protein [Halovenus rubra]|uniref:PGF-CTERM sorting domain-containing protein n=2 Tax=Halovenus rubra TaxID=869890 RepID=A0ABD5X684_9EURY|nr:PGF-CTERM sorting domain-containing protein [Halovenus rubra]